MGTFDHLFSLIEPELGTQVLSSPKKAKLDFGGMGAPSQVLSE